jgi:hypothetical protein
LRLRLPRLMPTLPLYGINQRNQMLQANHLLSRRRRDTLNSWILDPHRKPTVRVYFPQKGGSGMSQSVLKLATV